MRRAGGRRKCGDAELMALAKHITEEHGSAPVRTRIMSGDTVVLDGTYPVSIGPWSRRRPPPDAPRTICRAGLSAHRLSIEAVMHSTRDSRGSAGGDA